MLFGCQNISSPDQEVPDVQVSPEEVITDTTPFTDVPSDSVPDVSEVVILQRSAMSNENQLSATAGLSPNKIIGEIGQLSINQPNANRWHKMTFLNEFRNPVVIMQPMSYNGGDPAVIRIRNVTTLDFEFQIDEWDYLDGGHVKETITYLVMETGLWINGLVYEVGKVRTNHNFKSVNLKYPFPSGSVILTQAQTINGTAAITTRQEPVAGGFRVKVQEEEAADGIHATEDIGYIAILPGEGPFGKFQALSAKTGNVVSHNFKTINYSFTTPTFGNSYFLAGMQTFEGIDTASLRYKSLTKSSVQVRVEEEKSADTETNHPNEAVGYLLLRQVDFDEGKLTAYDGETEDRFARSVAIDGNTMVVGASGDDDQGTDSGSAYIYERNAKGKWTLVKKISSSVGDSFGRVVAISGDTVVVGTISSNSLIFERNRHGTNQWGLVKTISVGSKFIIAVAISGDTVVVGTPFDDDKGRNSGSAHIFERNIGGSNNWGEVKKITASDGAADDEFGTSVTISGDTVAIGAFRSDGLLGSAYIFERDNGGSNNWGQTKKIIASDGVAGDKFGEFIAISESTLVVGNGASFPSPAYIFERNIGGNNNWGQVKKIIDFDGRFGAPVAISGDAVVIGALGDDDSGSFSGAAHIYQRNNGGSNNWGQFKKITASDGATDDYFGLSVAISEDTVVVGVQLDDDKGKNSGSAYVFE